MTIKSTNELLAQANATLPDNTTQEISPADVRTMIKDFIDTVAPAYSVMQRLSGVVALTATPVKITPFSAVLADTPSHYIPSLAIGTLTRLIASAGLAGATDFMIVSGEINAGNGNNVTIEIYKDGVATGYKSSVTTTGGADLVGFNIAALMYKGGADAEYEIRASAVPNGNYTFAEVAVIAQAQPVRSFV